eukprot:CAMPEP_0119328510 /NCGR_PEP_ID=MMETSP1333-20130426/73523_1 /TAXON_ID=418940 /ORGANISM="Scyphosphaera apsteinii, Strain RCC1455" /LENGTH=78 /DNA_ID=CAMNT_0007337387 /DNA_START=77 /DNA_END=313 /DNA_ORIENTATION=+
MPFPVGQVCALQVCEPATGPNVPKRDTLIRVVAAFKSGGGLVLMPLVGELVDGHEVLATQQTPFEPAHFVANFSGAER